MCLHLQSTFKCYSEKQALLCPCYKGSTGHFSAVYNVCSSALWLLRQLQWLEVPLCKDVLIWAFALDMTKLLFKHEMTILGFFKWGAWRAFYMSPPPLPLIFSWVECWRKHSCRHVTHRNLCSTSESPLTKIQYFKQWLSWKIVPVVSLTCWHLHWEENWCVLGQIIVPHSLISPLSVFLW